LSKLEIGVPEKEAFVSQSEHSSKPSAPPVIGQSIPYDRFLDCVHCGLCTAACPTYVETGDENDGPRGRIYLMRSVIDGRLDLTEKVRHHLDLCLDCRSCETACPSGVQYGRLIEPFRVEMHQLAQPTGASSEAARINTAPHKPDWFHRWILYGLFPSRSRMKWALLPARWMQRLRIDKAIDKLGLNRLLPERLQRMQSQLPKGLAAQEWRCSSAVLRMRCFATSTGPPPVFFRRTAAMLSSRGLRPAAEPSTTTVEPHNQRSV
jgi:ferredoxin